MKNDRRERALTTTVESHPSGSSIVMLSDADSFDRLLGYDIAGCEEHLKTDRNPPGSASIVLPPFFNQQTGDGRHSHPHECEVERTRTAVVML